MRSHCTSSSKIFTLSSFFLSCTSFTLTVPYKLPTFDTSYLTLAFKLSFSLLQSSSNLCKLSSFSLLRLTARLCSDSLDLLASIFVRKSSNYFLSYISECSNSSIFFMLLANISSSCFFSSTTSLSSLLSPLRLLGTEEGTSDLEASESALL